MATVKYAENIEIRSGLQPDTRDHKASETQLAKIRVYDILIGAISALPVTHGIIVDKQRYYFPTIKRKAAYHGAFLKYFPLFGDFSVVIGGSLDHQYPLEVFLTYRGILVKSLYTFKASSKAITNKLLPNTIDLSIEIADRLNLVNYKHIAESIDKHFLLTLNFSAHWRKFKKQCISFIATYA